jgi:hypothetical protein
MFNVQCSHVVSCLSTPTCYHTYLLCTPTRECHHDFTLSLSLESEVEFIMEILPSRGVLYVHSIYDTFFPVEFPELLIVIDRSR